MIYPQILLYLRYFFKTPAGASRPHIMWLHTKSMKTANPNLSWSTVEAMSVEKMVKLKDVRKLTTLGETHHIFFLRHFCRTFLGKYRGNLAQKSPRFPWICMGKNCQVVHFMKSLVIGGHWILSILNLNHFFGWNFQVSMSDFKQILSLQMFDFFRFGWITHSAHDEGGCLDGETFKGPVGSKMEFPKKHTICCWWFRNPAYHLEYTKPVVNKGISTTCPSTG